HGRARREKLPGTRVHGHGVSFRFAEMVRDRPGHLPVPRLRRPYVTGLERPTPCRGASHHVGRAPPRPAPQCPESAVFHRRAPSRPTPPCAESAVFHRRVPSHPVPRAQFLTVKNCALGERGGGARRGGGRG